MKPREKSMKWFMLMLFVTTNCTKGEYVTDVDTSTLNDEFNKGPEIHSEYVKDHLKTSELRSSKDRLILPKTSRYNERDENSNVNKLKTSRRMLPERYSNIDIRRNYSIRETREVYLEMPRFRTNNLDSSRTTGLERSLKNMNNHRFDFSKEQGKVRIRGYTTAMPDATSNAPQLAQNRSRDRFYVTRQNYRDNFKQGDKVSEMRYLIPVIQIRTFRQNSISASNEGQKPQERSSRVEQNNRYRRFIRMENVRKQNDRQQINRNQFERIRANSRDNIIHFASKERSALTKRFIPKTLSSIFAEKQLITQEILEITDNRQISLNRQKRNTVRQVDTIQNTREILHDADSQKFRKFNKNVKRIAEDRHRDGITKERINVNIDSRQRTTEDRYRDGASRERMNVNINSRQRSAENRHQDSITGDRININTHPKQRIAEDHHRDSITRERINGNINNKERIAKDRLRTDSTRERINANIHSRQRTAEDRYRDDTSRERMDVNINSRQRSAENRHQDSMTRDRINSNTHSKQRIAEDHHRDSITRERINGNINNKERIAKDRLRTDSTRERINANIHSRQRTAEDRYRDDTSRERINVNINSRQRSAENRHQDSITRDRININTHPKQRIAEDHHRDSIARERFNGNSNSRERTAKDRFQTDSTRELINANIHSRQRTVEDRYRDDTSRERMNVNINSRQRSAEGRYQDGITRDRININAHSRQRIAEDRYRDDTSRERMNVNINSRKRSAEGQYQDSITRERININAHSRQRIAEDHHRYSITRERINGNINNRERIAKDRLRTDSTRERINANIPSRQRTAEDRNRDDTSRERMNGNINSRPRSAEGRYQDSITRERFNGNSNSRERTAKDRLRTDSTRERINANIHSRQRTAEDRYRDDTSRERMNVNINSRQRSAEGRYQDSITRDRININAHSRQRIAENHQRNGITREQINGNINSGKRIVRDDLTRESINVNIHSRQYPNKNNEERIGSNKIKILGNRSERSENNKLTRNRIASQTHNQIRDIRNSYQRNLMRNDRFQTSSRRIQHFDKENQIVNYLPRSMNRRTDDRQRNIAERSSSKSSERKIEITQNQNRHTTILREIDTRNTAKSTRNIVEKTERNSQRNSPEKRQTHLYEVNRKMEKMRNSQSRNGESNEKQRILTERNPSKSSDRRTENIQNRNKHMNILNEEFARDYAKNTQTNVEQKERNMQEKRRIRAHEINRNVEKMRNRQSMNRESNERQRILVERSSSKSGERRKENIQNQNRRMNILTEIDTQDSIEDTQSNVEQRERNAQRNAQEKRRIRSYEINRNVENIRKRQIRNRESNERQRIFAERSSSKSSERRMENIQNQNRRIDVLRQIDIRNSARNRRNVELNGRNSQRNAPEERQIHSYEININMEKIRSRQNTNRESNERQRTFAEKSSSKSSERRMDKIQNQNRRIDVLRQIEIQSSARNTRRSVGLNERDSQRNTLEKRENRSYKVNGNIEKVKNRQSINRESTERQHIFAERSSSKSSERRMENIQNQNRRMTASMGSLSESLRTSKFSLRARSYITVPRKFIRIQLIRIKENSKRIANSNRKNEERIIKANGGEDILPGDRNVRETHNVKAYILQLLKVNSLSARNVKSRQREKENNYRYTRQTILEKITEDENREHRYSHRISENTLQRILNKDFSEKVQKDSDELIKSYKLIRIRNGRRLQERHLTEPAEERIGMTNRNVRTQRSRRLQEKHCNELSKERTKMMTNINARTRTDKLLQDRHFTETSQERIRTVTNKNARTQTGRQLQERHCTELSEERIKMMANRIIRTQRSRELQDRHFTVTSEKRIRIVTNENARTRIGRQFTELSEEGIRMMTHNNLRTPISRQLQKRYVNELSEKRIRIMTNRNVRTRTSRKLQERHFTELSEERIRMMTNRNARTRTTEAVFERKIQDVERLSIQGARKSTEKSVRVNNYLRITSKVIGDQSHRKNLIADERHFEFQLRMTDKNLRTRTTEKGFERKIQNRERSSVQIARKINERSVTVVNGLRIISKVIRDQSYRKNAVSDERHTKLQLRMNGKLSRQARERIHDVRFLGRVDFGQESKEKLMLQKRQARLHEISVYLKQKVSQTKKLLENIRENTAVNKRNRACFRGKSAEPQMKSIEVLILTRQNAQPRVASKRNIRDLHNSDNLQMKSVAFGSQNSHLLRQRNGRGYRGRYLEQTAERRARIFSVNTRTLHKATNNHKFSKSTNGAQTSSVAIRESIYVEKLFGQKMSVVNTRKNIHNLFTRTIISESGSRLPRRITVSPKELIGPSSARVHSLRINLGSNRRLNNIRSRSDSLNNLNKLNQRIRENRYFDNQFRNVQFTRDLNARQKSANSYDDVRKRSLPLSRQNRQQISRNSLNEIRHSIPREEMRRTRKNILRVEIREISKQENYNLLSSNSAPGNNNIQKFSALEVVSMPKTNIFEDRKSSPIQGTQEGRLSTYTSDSQEYWKISINSVSSFLVNLILGFLIILATSERNEIKTKPFKERLADILFLRSSVF